ncbi:MAG TPA: uroporphyrinogen-III synthase [Gammaproteobacteria bacterium]|nr:uroporphyrinogen-III synthase [Gammaproteobacteria bacterium]
MTVPLAGCSVLVTRPAHQAGALAAAIEAGGGRALRFPVLEIRGPSDPGVIPALAERLDTLDLVVFVSVNAIERGLPPLLACRDWPAHLPIAVIGRRSAEALEAFGLHARLCPPERFDSEGLLALEALQDMRGRRVVILRGDSGREYLADSLRARGADVEYVECYRRVLPQADPAPVLAALEAGDIDIVQCNSVESLQNLDTLLGEKGRAALRRTPLLVVSERMQPVARDMGFAAPLVLAANATDAAVLAALAEWWAGRRDR